MAEDIKKWWKDLPWFWKIPASVVFIAIAAIAVLQLLKRPVNPPNVADGAHNEVIKTVLDGLQDDVDESKEKVEAAKKEIVKEIAAANKDYAESGTIEERVKKAKTAAELKKIVEEFGL